jgi:cytochrome oxidase Cu insertion factor (SCO1/SenC/PrrC family)
MNPPPVPDEHAHQPSHRRPSPLLGKPVMVALVVAAVVTAAFAVVAVRIHHQPSQPGEIRVSGLPASVPTSLASLMALSPVPRQPAPDFSLVDQNGRDYSLSAFRGKSVVLEFMDPHCTDICPIISEEFVDAYHDLGGDRSKVVFLAVNVNPYHLAVADAAAFTTEHQLNTIPSWHFLTGPVGTLMATWQRYGVQVDAPNPSADVIHSSFVYFVDPSGHERYLGAPQDDHRAGGASYLPADQIATWGQGIALVARSLATPSPPS